MAPTTVRRQRSALAFSHNLTTFLGHATLPQTHQTTKCSPQRTDRRLNFVDTPREPHSPIVMVAAPPPKIKTPSKRKSSPMIKAPPVIKSPPKINSPHSRSRFTRPVPEAKPHEVLQPKRGRNSRRRIVEAEHFRKYIYLRRQLKPWSDAFRAKHGRTPSLIDVHASDIPGLMDRFVEYLDALELLRVDV